MKLEMMTGEDVGLRVRLETDPQVMAGLGGPRLREAIERAHVKSLALAAEGRCWPLKIIPDGGTSPAGGVDVFESSHEDEAIYEIGWMILPEFQNRGIASQAVREVLEKARGERMFGQIHAFPAVTNGPSNKICEKNGFMNLGECEVEFAGRGLRCNHWRIFRRDPCLPWGRHRSVVRAYEGGCPVQPCRVSSRRRVRFSPWACSSAPAPAWTSHPSVTPTIRDL
jgi:RimJ/RimL family protein N-acetyltransferase